MEGTSSTVGAKEDQNSRSKEAVRLELDHRRHAQASTVEPCIICLEPISERAIAVPCNHLAFDFNCLALWLKERSACPLCNASVASVQYDWRGPDNFRTYQSSRAQHKVENAHQRSQGREVPAAARNAGDRVRQAADPPSSHDPTLERRKEVYRHCRYSQHVGANRVSCYREISPTEFAASPVLQSRARMFLRRELQVFGFLNTASAPRGGNREFLLEYIVAILKINEIKGADGAAEHLLTDYLESNNARLLLHELGAWLRSPYSQLEEWDQRTQYAEDADPKLDS